MIEIPSIPLIEIPRIPLGDWVEEGIELLISHVSGATRAFSETMGQILSLFDSLLGAVPPWALIAVLALLAWKVSRSKIFGVVTCLGFALIWNMGLWEPALATITLVMLAAFLAVGIGLPLGMAVAISTRLKTVVMPLLDAMQTMPAFVYLIPAIPFFGIGKISALFATIIFSMPPVIRFTYLGINGIPAELVECAEAFGASRFKRLLKLELPLAAPTIMAGINQTVMLALSMVVIAAMIGARGLGGEVWKAIQRLEMGKGFEAGLGIVIVAIYFDRLLQYVGKRLQKRANSRQIDANHQ